MQAGRTEIRAIFWIVLKPSDLWTEYRMHGKTRTFDGMCSSIPNVLDKDSKYKRTGISSWSLFRTANEKKRQKFVENQSLNWRDRNRVNKNMSDSFESFSFYFWFLFQPRGKHLHVCQNQTRKISHPLEFTCCCCSSEKYCFISFLFYNCVGQMYNWWCMQNTPSFFFATIFKTRLIMARAKEFKHGAADVKQNPRASLTTGAVLH